MALEQGTPMDLETIPGWHLARPRAPLERLPLRPAPPKIAADAHPLTRERLSRGLTQAALARKVGITDHSTVSKWEAGTRAPLIRHLARLAKALDVPVDVALSWFVAA